MTVAVGRFGIGEPGDVIVLGRWACGPVALPAVLRPRPGSVWVFDRWPAAGLDVAARPVGEVGGAVSLTVVPGTSGCDHIEVRRGAGSSEMIDPAAPR